MKDLGADHAPGIRPGTGQMTVEVVAGQSAVTSAYASSPLKLLVPRSRGPNVWGYLGSFGGGLLAGDEIRFELRLAENARCFLSTQASTKVYRNPASRPCGHEMRAELGAGAVLVLAPEAVQAFAGSTYNQRQQLHLSATSSLVLVDWLSSGRSACGERWAFTRFQNRLEVFIGSRRLLFESLLLDPADGPLAGPQRLGRFNALALVFMVGPAWREASQRLLAELGHTPVARRANLLFSASPLHDGLLLRLAGEHSEAVGAEIRQRLAFLADWLDDNPWSRKW